MDAILPGSQAEGLALELSDAIQQVGGVSGLLSGICDACSFSVQGQAEAGVLSVCPGGWLVPFGSAGGRVYVEGRRYTFG